MYKLKFGKFWRGEYPKKHNASDLYVLLNSDDVLYVGISTAGIWNRWFGLPSAHIFSNLQATSRVGRAVVECLPDSLDWIIELWTLDDLDRQFKSPRRSLLELESMMIDLRLPILNVQGVNYTQKRMRWEVDRDDFLDRAYDKIFNKEEDA